MAGVLEFPCQRLDTPFRGRFVEQDEASLAILFLPVQSAQILIKPAAQLFEGNFRYILAREILLFQDRRKNSYVWMAVAHSHI